MTTRRSLLQLAAGGGLSIAMFRAAQAGQTASAASTARLRRPSGRKIRVAFMIGVGANVIDTAGPWEVFQDVGINAAGEWAEDGDYVFDLYTVGENDDLATMTGGMIVKPNYTVDNAPPPDLMVIPAQTGPTPRTVAWIREKSAEADVTMSVCTGAFALAATGLLDGLQVTTHHDYWDAFAERYPELNLVRGQRFVDNGNIASAGGLTSGIDMALHVVERYYGRDIAQATADYMEYQSDRWQS